MAHRPANPQTLQLLAIDAFFELVRAGGESSGATSALRSASGLGEEMMMPPASAMHERFDAVRLALLRHAEQTPKAR